MMNKILVRPICKQFLPGKRKLRDNNQAEPLPPDSPLSPKKGLADSNSLVAHMEKLSQSSAEDRASQNSSELRSELRRENSKQRALRWAADARNAKGSCLASSAITEWERHTRLSTKKPIDASALDDISEETLEALGKCDISRRDLENVFDDQSQVWAEVDADDFCEALIASRDKVQPLQMASISAALKLVGSCTTGVVLWSEVLREG